jgi:hypothetical protein
MPCFLSSKSKSVLAKPLEHQCSSSYSRHSRAPVRLVAAEAKCWHIPASRRKVRLRRVACRGGRPGSTREASSRLLEDFWSPTVDMPTLSTPELLCGLQHRPLPASGKRTAGGRPAAAYAFAQSGSNSRSRWFEAIRPHFSSDRTALRSRRRDSSFTPTRGHSRGMPAPPVGLRTVPNARGCPVQV